MTTKLCDPSKTIKKHATLHATHAKMCQPFGFTNLNGFVNLIAFVIIGKKIRIDLWPHEEEQQQLHESLVNRLYGCKPVEKS